LSIHEPSHDAFRIPEAVLPKCTRYHVISQVITIGDEDADSSDDGTDDGQVCDHTNQLPSDLSSADGGSVAYGGPQDSLVCVVDRAGQQQQQQYLAPTHFDRD
jgi:hypothetical protein